MEIRPIMDSDMEEINSWYHKRNMTPMPKEALPKTGFIVPKVAVAYLYTSDSNVGFIDGCIANPDMDKAIRWCALHKILDYIVEAAKDKNIGVLIATSSKNSIKEICASHGFNEVGMYTTFVKEI